jgi:hypothetical protein
MSSRPVSVINKTNRPSGLTSDLLNQYLLFNKITVWLTCTLKFEKHRILAKKFSRIKIHFKYKYVFFPGVFAGEGG